MKKTTKVIYYEGQFKVEFDPSNAYNRTFKICINDTELILSNKDFESLFNVIRGVTEDLEKDK
jgi:hypothetical protein